VLRPGAGPATYLREIVTPLRAVLRHASERGWCDAPTIKAPKTTEGRTRYLSPAEAGQLIAAAANHLRPLLLFLVGTVPEETTNTVRSDFDIFHITPGLIGDPTLARFQAPTVLGFTYTSAEGHRPKPDGSLPDTEQVLRDFAQIFSLSGDHTVTPAAHTRRKPGILSLCERRAVRWRERDSNFRLRAR
jgi:hypothetical protein